MKSSNTISFLIILASLVFLASCTNSTGTTTTSSAVSSSDTVVTSRIPTVSSTLTRQVTYRTDHGKERTTVEFSISRSDDGTITGVTATMLSGDRESSQHVSRFGRAITGKVVGKKVSSLSLSTVGGASDTTDAFTQVLASL